MNPARRDAGAPSAGTAASSIALNLAEGCGKSSKTDRRRFYEIAMGSLRECQAILQLEDLDSTSQWKKLDEVAAALYKLLKALS